MNISVNIAASLDRGILYRTVFTVEAGIFNLVGGYCYNFPFQHASTTCSSSPFPSGVHACPHPSLQASPRIYHKPLHAHSSLFTCSFLTDTTCLPHVYHDPLIYINSSRTLLYSSLLFIQN